jgi:hypothetical protein
VDVGRGASVPTALALAPASMRGRGGGPLLLTAGERGERRARWVTLRDLLRDVKSSLGDTKSSLGDAKSSLGDTKSSLGDAKSSLGDAKSSLGDAKSSLGDAKRSAA